jgi:drug/metabolite transporter (DMT)-like permease
MKAFIRSLNIEERKALMYAFSYSLFKSLSALLIKIMSDYYKVDSLTVVCERGSMLSLICLSRIIFIIKNNKTKRDVILDLRNYKDVLIRAILNCLSFSFMIFALYNLPMSDYFAITRQSPLLTIFLSQFFFQEEMQNFQIIGCILDGLGLSFIILPTLLDNPLGIFCAILVTGFKTFSEILNKHIKTINIDILILFTGVYSALLGSFLMIISSGKIDHYSFFQWILIFLNAIFTYYAILFQTIALKKARNIGNLFPFTIISVLVTLIFGVLFFGQKVHFYELIGIGIIILNTIFYSNKMIKYNRKKKELSNYAFYE